MCHIGGRDGFLPSALLFLRHSVIYFYGVATKGLLKYLHLYASYILFDWSVRPGTYSFQHPRVMRLVDASNTSLICFSPTGVFRCSDKKKIILFVICLE